MLKNLISAAIGNSTVISTFFQPLQSTLMHTSLKHEIVSCERCQSAFECKANSFTKCQCAEVQLTLNETQYVSELYNKCLCAACLLQLQREYQSLLNS